MVKTDKKEGDRDRAGRRAKITFFFFKTVRTRTLLRILSSQLLKILLRQTKKRETERAGRRAKITFFFFKTVRTRTLLRILSSQLLKILLRQTPRRWPVKWTYPRP